MGRDRQRGDETKSGSGRERNLKCHRRMDKDYYSHITHNSRHHTTTHDTVMSPPRGVSQTTKPHPPPLFPNPSRSSFRRTFIHHSTKISTLPVIVSYLCLVVVAPDLSSLVHVPAPPPPPSRATRPITRDRDDEGPTHKNPLSLKGRDTKSKENTFYPYHYHRLRILPTFWFTPSYITSRPTLFVHLLQ